MRAQHGGKDSAQRGAAGAFRKSGLFCSLDYALNSQSEHKKIYAALEARDAMAARAEMEKHILRSMDDALTYYL